MSTTRRPARKIGRGTRLAIGYFALAALAIAGVVTFASLHSGGAKAAFVAGKPIDGITCGAMEGQVQHVHQYLEFVIDGRYYTAPESVGIIPDTTKAQTIRCLYWSHTHTPDGVIHVEAPVKDTVTLGQFFDIWTVSSVSRMLVDRFQAGAPDRVIVDGKPYTGDVRAIPLQSHTMITIEYGATPMPQRSFDFQKAGLTT